MNCDLLWHDIFTNTSVKYMYYVIRYILSVIFYKVHFLTSDIKKPMDI